MTPIALALAAVWFLGVFYSYTMGGYIHLMLAVSIGIFAYQAFQNRRGASATTTIDR